VFTLMTRRAFEIHGRAHTLSFSRAGKTLFTATVSTSNIGLLDGRTVSHEQTQVANAATTTPLTTALWHRRLAHINLDDILDLQRTRAATGVSIVGKRDKTLCEPCLAGKMHRHAIPRGPARRATQVFAVIHSDVKGPLPRSVQGFRYWVVFVDD
ncbi:hypothetical protein EXIGLDRAFT_590599, partial [Exidia glandulosa HHB12029]